MRFFRIGEQKSSEKPYKIGTYGESCPETRIPLADQPPRGPVRPLPDDPCPDARIWRVLPRRDEGRMPFLPRRPRCARRRSREWRADPAARRSRLPAKNQRSSMVYLVRPSRSAFEHLEHSLIWVVKVLPSLTPRHIVQLPALQQEHCSSLQQSPHFSDLQHSHCSQHGNLMHMFTVLE